MMIATEHNAAPLGSRAAENHVPRNSLGGSSAAELEVQSCILVAARVLNRLRRKAKVAPHNVRTC
jgi:hypothetical protein